MRVGAWRQPDIPDQEQGHASIYLNDQLILDGMEEARDHLAHSCKKVEGADSEKGRDGNPCYSSRRTSKLRRGAAQVWRRSHSVCLHAVPAPAVAAILQGVNGVR